MSNRISLKSRVQPGVWVAIDRPKASIEPLAVRVPVAMQMIGVGRTTVYTLVNSGKLQTVKIGRATLITMSSLRRLVESQIVPEP